MSRSPVIKFVYFDVGGVLLHFYHIREVLAKRWGIDPAQYQHFMRQVEGARSSGTMTEAEVEAALNREFGGVVPTGYWANAEFVSLFTPITPMHEMVYALAPVYRLGLLTNVTETVWHTARTEFPHLYPQVQFEEIVASYQEKVAKPDPEIYRRAIARTQLLAPEICFIDDMPENLAVASQLGMQTIQSFPLQIEKTVQIIRQTLLP